MLTEAGLVALVERGEQSDRAVQPWVTCETEDPVMKSISVTELREILAGSFDGILIDVREPFEHAVSQIEGAVLIPLATLEQRLGELPRDREILIHCKAGGRSAKAVRLLLDHQFTRVANVTGGIDAWLAGG